VVLNQVRSNLELAIGLFSDPRGNVWIWIIASPQKDNKDVLFKQTFK
jgi:hypothetical protein